MLTKRMKTHTHNRFVILYDSFFTTELRDIHHISVAWWHNTILHNHLSDYIITFRIFRFALAWPSIRTINLNVVVLTTTVAPQTKKAWSTCLPDTSVLPRETLYETTFPLLLQYLRPIILWFRENIFTNKLKFIWVYRDWYLSTGKTFPKKLANSNQSDSSIQSQHQVITWLENQLDRKHHIRLETSEAWVFTKKMHRKLSNVVGYKVACLVNVFNFLAGG